MKKIFCCDLFGGNGSAVDNKNKTYRNLYSADSLTNVSSTNSSILDNNKQLLAYKAKVKIKVCGLLSILGLLGVYTSYVSESIYSDLDVNDIINNYTSINLTLVSSVSSILLSLVGSSFIHEGSGFDFDYKFLIFSFVFSLLSSFAVRHFLNDDLSEGVSTAISSSSALIGAPVFVVVLELLKQLKISLSQFYRYLDERIHDYKPMY